jgi:hypothetical protein
MVRSLNVNGVLCMSDGDRDTPFVIVCIFKPLYLDKDVPLFRGLMLLCRDLLFILCVRAACVLLLSRSQYW